MKSIPKELADYIVYTTIIREGNIVYINSNHPSARSVIQLLCHSESITGLFQFSLLNSDEKEAIVLLSQGKVMNANKLSTIFKRMYTLEILINSITPLTINRDQLQLHPMIAPLLRIIMIQINNLCKRTSRNIIEYITLFEDYYTYFPFFPKHFK